MATTLNTVAQTFKALHKPGNPVILANVYDGISARTVASLPSSQAIATASHAVAASVGLDDDDLTLGENLRATRIIASAIVPFNKPLTVDLQDGYDSDLEHAVKELISIGVVGINLEDFSRTTNSFYTQSEAADRVRRVLAVANAQGVPDFVVNARSDKLVHGGTLDEVIARGQAYLAAGATTVFVWGGSGRGGVARDEVVKLVEAFEGRLSVILKLAGGLTARELADIGVARISVGPALQRAAIERLKETAEKVLEF
ncbi:isocitrate lyase/PEP mutase family protein [Aspergillus lucknowensis]|uniref:Phosphoenolpyruvate phosphomutase-domain-containing protein n=1 Tax=Aspergillus lucknowensis TaxID=176173 RepID=A0ABR4LMN9_9EURO